MRSCPFSMRTGNPIDIIDRSTIPIGFLYPGIRAFMAKVLTVTPQQLWKTAGREGIIVSYLGLSAIHISPNGKET